MLPGDCSLWIKEQSVGKVPPSEVVSEEIAKVLSTAADSSLLKDRCLGLSFRNLDSVGIRWNYKSAYSPRSPMMLTSWFRTHFEYGVLRASQNVASSASLDLISNHYLLTVCSGDISSFNSLKSMMIL